MCSFSFRKLSKVDGGGGEGGSGGKIRILKGICDG